jgi:hypothetical protein
MTAHLRPVPKPLAHYACARSFDSAIGFQQQSKRSVAVKRELNVSTALLAYLGADLLFFFGIQIYIPQCVHKEYRGGHVVTYYG